MGVTSHSLNLLDKVIARSKQDQYPIDSVIEMGAQNLYDKAYPEGYPFASVWYEKRGIKNYKCIDLNGENNAEKIDLEKELNNIYPKGFPLVTDFGTSEHIRDAYAINKTIYDLTATGGYIIRENPKTGNWKGHGFNYMTQEFYKQLAKDLHLKIIELGEFPAMGNTTDGWNIYCMLRKTETLPFVTREQFKLYDVRPS